MIFSAAFFCILLIKRAEVDSLSKTLFLQVSGFLVDACGSRKRLLFFMWALVDILFLCFMAVGWSYLGGEDDTMVFLALNWLTGMLLSFANPLVQLSP